MAALVRCPIISLVIVIVRCYLTHMNKLCRKCDTVKPLTEFHNNKNTKDGKVSNCKPCCIARADAWQKAHPEKAKARKAKWHKENIDQERERLRKYREENPDRVRANYLRWRDAEPNREKEYNAKRYAENKEAKLALNKKWAEKHPERLAAVKAKYRASKLQRTPEWLTQEHHDQIVAKYAERDRLNKETGIEHHVDHILPLQGENVSGLHVPWNLQVITATENHQKSNYY